MSNINWDATAFFASLTEKNKFAKAHDFVFARVSGLDGFEEVLQQLQSAVMGRSSAQRNPVYEYQKEALISYGDMKDAIMKNIARNVLLNSMHN